LPVIYPIPPVSTVSISRNIFPWNACTADELSIMHQIVAIFTLSRPIVAPIGSSGTIIAGVTY
jgi:hypothetical protein